MEQYEILINLCNTIFFQLIFSLQKVKKQNEALHKINIAKIEQIPLILLLHFTKGKNFLGEGFKLPTLIPFSYILLQVENTDTYL